MRQPRKPAVPPGDDAATEDRQFVTALARGLDILGCFSAAEPEIGGTRLAAMTGLPQPTVWRLCHTMVKLGFLVAVSGDRLRPGIPALKLGRAALATIAIAEAARAAMQDLANRFGSACGLAVRDGSRMVFVQRCLSDAQLVMNLRVGDRLPLVSSGVGWGMLAGFEPAAREALIAQYGAPDPRWQQTEKPFRQALEKFKATGVMLNLGTFHRGYNTAAVPLYGPDGCPAYALSCAGSAVSHTPAFLRREAAPALQDLAATLQVGLSAPAPVRATA